MEFVRRLKTSLEKHAELNAMFINGTYYSYKQLAESVSSIRKLITSLIPEDQKLIGLVTNDDLQTYASIIALWLEGKAYVPVNPIYPIDRNVHILQLTESKFVLDSSDTSVYPSVFSVVPTKDLTSSTINLTPKEINCTDLAYILFTSGSTGTPKGVPITFENLNGLVVAIDNDERFNLTPEDRCLQMFELTFDFSLVAYLPPFLYGSCIYTIPKNSIKYFYIFKLITQQDLTVLTMVPSIIHYLRPYFAEINSPSVRYCSFGGGKLHHDIAQEWNACLPNCEIFNYYGPTEFTVYSGYYPYTPKTNNKNYNGVVSIGKPFYGVDYLLVDEDNQEVRLGETGELCLAGIQITPGYWKDDERNKRSFFNHKSNGVPKRYYKTGDLCFKDNEGDYLYVERADFQVKIRGYRVELSEVEFYAKQIIKKTEIIAIDIENELGNTELGLAIVAKEFDLTETMAYLQEKLPSYMVPSKTLFLKEFPHNTNDKVDRAKLRQLFNLK